MNTSFNLSLALAVALLCNVLLKFWLNTRQVRYVARHRGAVPLPFDGTIRLSDHHKAADYTVAKIRLSQLDIAIDAACLLAWTLLGGLDALNMAIIGWFGAGMSQQIALVLGFSFIGGLIGLPLSLYQTFVLEQAFGFNKVSKNTTRLLAPKPVKKALECAERRLPSITKKPFAVKPARCIKALTRSLSNSSSNGVNLLNKGMIIFGAIAMMNN